MMKYKKGVAKSLFLLYYNISNNYCYDLIKKGGCMAALKHSRQRDCIKEFLMSRQDHPTADMVYAHVREEFPHISLGTVYRNLSLLSEIGEIMKITCNGPDRFDANTMPHYHFTCNCCGCVEDLKFEQEPDFSKLSPMDFSGTIEQTTLSFSGTCDACIKHS